MDKKALRKQAQAKNKIHMSMAWGFAGWCTLFTILFMIPSGILYFQNKSYFENLPENTQALFLLGMIITVWPLSNYVFGILATQLVIRKRIKKKILFLKDGITLKEVEKTLFKRWFWIVMLVQFGIAATLIAIEVFLKKDLGNLSSAQTIIMGFVFAAAVQKYEDKLYTIPIEGSEDKELENNNLQTSL